MLRQMIGLTTLVAVLAPAGIGCQHHEGGRGRAGKPALAPATEPAADEASVRRYFAGLRDGTPVSQIERDLRLTPSEDREAPTFEPRRENWRVHYRQHGLRIGFDARDLTAAGDDLVYAGEPTVMTEEEYYLMLRGMGI